MPRHPFIVCFGTSLLSVQLLVSCMAPEDKKPDNLINADQMANILTEVHLAESRISRLSLRSLDSSNIAYKHLETKFLKQFGVDTATFRRSYVFYSSHPQQMEEVYKRVVEKLQKKTNPKKANHA